MPDIPKSLRPAAGALSFLTIVPAGRLTELTSQDIARGSWFFPVIGAAVGAVSAGTAWALAIRFPGIIAAIVAVGVEVVITGAMHVDGFADTADALGGGGRERALDIMRDHSIGTFGASALFLDLLLKIACVATLVAHHRLALVIAAAAISRATAPALARLLPYARAEGGVITGRTSTAGAISSVVIGIAIAAALAGSNAIWPSAAVVILAALLGLAFKKWLGGVTGDTLGATIELCGTAALFAAAGLA